MEDENEKITTVCIPTCDRPESLRKSLSGLLDNLKKYNRAPRILVADDSENKESTEITKQICGSFGAQYFGKIECIDRNDRAEMAKKISKEKEVPEEVVHFALLGDKLSTTTLGAVRNTFFLKTLGEKIMMADDDVVCKTFSLLPENSPIFTIENPLDFWLFKKGESLPKLFKPIEIDLLSVHEATLGKSTEDILGDATPEYIKKLKIMDTYMGLYGDSPMESHVPLLFLPQVHEKLKNISLSEYQTLKETRHIIQSPTAITIYQGPICMSLLRGIDNRQPLPPFLPVDRAEDLVWGTTRHKAFPLNISVYIPFIIGHERPHEEAQPAKFDGVQEFTKIKRIITSFINEIEEESIDPSENFQIIGDKFVKISNESPQIFALIMKAQCEKIAREVANYVNNLLKSSSNMPDFWINDMKYIINDLSSPDPKLFLADITKKPINDKMAILQKWMGLYGQLLKEWHKLF